MVPVIVLMENAKLFLGGLVFFTEGTCSCFSRNSFAAGNTSFYLRDQVEYCNQYN